jgi:hypothetical protein
MGHDEELDKELRFHINARVDDLIAEGLQISDGRFQIEA